LALKGDFKFDGVKVSDIEYLKGKLDGIRKDIIYSPIRVYYELTTACNLRCKTCFNKSGEALKDELSSDEVIKIIEGLRKDNILDLRFTGGEITTKKGWDEILQHAKDLGFAVSMNTNAIFNDENIIDKIVEIAPNQVTLSFDGTKKTNDFIRGKGSFDRAFKT